MCMRLKLRTLTSYKKSNSIFRSLHPLSLVCTHAQCSWKDYKKGRTTTAGTLLPIVMQPMFHICRMSKLWKLTLGRIHIWVKGHTAQTKLNANLTQAVCSSVRIIEREKKSFVFTVDISFHPFPKWQSFDKLKLSVHIFLRQFESSLKLFITTRVILKYFCCDIAQACSSLVNDCWCLFILFYFFFAVYTFQPKSYLLVTFTLPANRAVRNKWECFKWSYI